MTHPFVEKLKQKCMWCDNEALYECDAIVGMSGEADKDGKVLYAPMERLEVWTCDALMCLVHRHVVGFFCGGKDSGTMDRCPHCAHHRDERSQPMAKEEADGKRRKLHAEIRRSQMRIR